MAHPLVKTFLEHGSGMSDTFHPFGYHPGMPETRFRNTIPEGVPDVPKRRICPLITLPPQGRLDYRYENNGGHWLETAFEPTEKDEFVSIKEVDFSNKPKFDVPCKYHCGGKNRSPAKQTYIYVCVYGHTFICERCMHKKALWTLVGETEEKLWKRYSAIASWYSIKPVKK